MSKIFYVGIMFILAFFVGSESYGQCADCTVTVVGNNEPVGIQDGSVLCILGTRTTPLNLGTTPNVRLCFDNTAIFTGGLVGNPITITNHGQLGDPDFPINLNLEAGSTLNNFGSITINTLNLNSGGIFNNMVLGSISISNTITLNGDLNNQGFINFNNGLTLANGETINNNGTISAVSFTNNGTVNSQGGIVNIGQTLINNGIFNIGNSSIGGDLLNFGEIIIINALNVNGNLENEDLANISAGSQPSYLSFGGTFSNIGCINGPSGTSLYVNDNPSIEGTCIIGDVFFGVKPNCINIIEVLDYIQDGYQYFKKVYVFSCNTTWVVPGHSGIDSEEEFLPMIEADVLIIAGGGGGGFGLSAGGGGAGGVNLVPPKVLTPGQPISITVGDGGAGSINPNRRGGYGSNSSFGLDIAIGGGGGGSNANNENAIQRNGFSGGSGGGGAYESNSGIGGGGYKDINTKGNKGEDGSDFIRTQGRAINMYFGGGGGGAEGPGQKGENSGNQGGGVARGGNGGAGFQDLSFLKNGIFYSGGGGGTSRYAQGRSFPGEGGSGVGGPGNVDGIGFNGVTAGSGGGAGSTGGGNGAKGVVMVTQSFRILPVNFIHFSSEFGVETRTSKLTWSTSKEWENSHFEIERSLDGTKSFMKIGEVAGMGWTDEVSEYSYEDDKLPLTGGNVFYRLKQVDFNGRFDYSDITAVRVPNIHFTKGVWRAYPNPTEGSGFNLELVDISQYHDEAISLKVLSSNISSEEMAFRNLQELNQSASAIMANAPKGLWIFEIQWGNKVERIKVMKK